MKTASLFKMFGRSPMKPLQEHMAVTYECAKKLEDFFLAALKQDWSTAETLQQGISMLEGKADNLKRDLRLHLPKGLFLPVAREDLLELLTMQDRIANRAKDIAGIITGRQMSIPAAVGEDILTYVRRNIDAVEQAYKAICELDDLLESGFQGNEVLITESMIVELSQIENDTDKIQVGIRKKIFALEKELPAVDVMFLYKILDWIGDLADRAEEAGGRLQILLAR